MKRHMGKEKGFALSSIRAREMRRFLERRGYRVEPGQHKHLKLRYDRFSAVLLPLRPGDDLSFVAVEQIAGAVELTPEELTAAVRSL
jgi:predicted RNA binding protein YcfA (HicA-like mRNA interferase family)